MKYICLDLETGIKEYLGRKGSYLTNDIVAIGVKDQDHDARAHILTNSGHLNLDEIDEFQIMVGHNIKFDLLYLWDKPVIQKWILNGGKIWDTQLAEYILTGQKNKFAALRHLAVHKYGCKEREKLMEKYWDKGIDTKDIPQELVLEDVTQDVLDTEAIMLQQVTEAKKLGMYNLIMLQMESLLATIEMEYNGLYIDQNHMNMRKELLTKEIQNIRLSLFDLTSHILPDENFSSLKQLSLLFFGGSYKEECQVPILNELGIHEQYKSGPRRGELKYKKGMKIIHMKGFGLKPLPEWETKKAGVYQTNEKVLQIISKAGTSESLKTLHKIPIQVATLLLQLREKSKMLGTYYDGFEKLIHTDSCIHGSLHHVATDTGRLSSSKPNLQNIPRG